MSQNLRVVRDQREQAAAYLADHPNCGRRELAEAVGWGQGTARKFLETQGAKGKRGRKPKTAKGVMQNSGRDILRPQDNAQPQLASPRPEHLSKEPAGALPSKVIQAPPPEPVLVTSLRPSKPIVPVIALGIGLSCVAVAINAQSGWRLGTDQASPWTFLVASAVVDLCALVLPTYARDAWSTSWLASLTMWLITAAAVVVAFIASVGYFDLHIGDMTASRAVAVSTAEAMEKRRSTAIDAAKAAVAVATASRQDECRIRGPKCIFLEGQERDRMKELREAIALPIPSVPPIADADPQVAGVLRLANWLGLHLTGTDIGNLWLGLLGLLTNLGGVLIGCALRR